ncbi:MAG: hypothetical protein P4L86_08430 [Mycobacterium sp.]|nr:hypothetical protein [Mycobacterium sp.]
MTRDLTADLSALHTLAADYRGHGAELATHAADLAAIAGRFTADTFGPAGAAFTAALSDAAMRQAQLAHRMSTHLCGGGATAAATAAGFADIDHSTGDRLGAWQ